MYEWGLQLAAFNTAAEVFYAIANDDKNLYLALKTSYPLVIERAINAGVALIITNSRDVNGISLTFPALDHPIDLTRIFQKKGQMETSQHARDSVILKNNSLIAINAKLIKLKGIPETDSLVSMYNTDCLKAASRFDDNGFYSYEMAIPLKYLQRYLDGNNIFYISLK